MTEISAADRQMAHKILAALDGDDDGAVFYIENYPKAVQAMLATTRALVTAEILAAAGVDEDALRKRVLECVLVPPDGGSPTDGENQVAQAAWECVRPALARLAAENARLREALTELLEVARLRGDDDLPHPADDVKLWTARMQSAWDDARAALGDAS